MTIREGGRRPGAYSGSLLVAPSLEAAAGGGRPLWAYVLAGILGIAAIYFLIRMIEWDRMNQATPGQDDPFLDDREDR